MTKLTTQTTQKNLNVCATRTILDALLWLIRILCLK